VVEGEWGGEKLMLRAVRELRTVIMNGWYSYEMDAAVKMLRGEESFTEEVIRWMETACPQIP
jgi:hypothetical protein